MSIETKEGNLEFRKQISGFYEQEKHQDQKDAQSAIEERLKACEPQTKTDSAVASTTIPADTIMTKDANANAVCYFSEPSWTLIDRKTGDTYPVHFGKNHSSRPHLDFTSDDSEAYRVLEKLSTYAIWPGVDNTRKPYAAGTVKGQINQMKKFMDWLSKKNLLRSDNLVTNPPNPNLVTKSALREEIERLMETTETTTEVLSFVSGISQWCNLGSEPYCPDWLKPAFGYRDVLDNAFCKTIAKFCVAKTSRYEAIDRDLLDPMFETAKHYIESFSKDIFWLQKQLGVAVTRHKQANHVNPNHLTTHSITKDVYDEIFSRVYTNTPRTDTPWFEPEYEIARRSETPDKENYRYLRTGRVQDEIDILIGAAIFILMTFTGMRHGELKRIATKALTINGEALDLRKNAIAQVEAAGENAFDITRPLFKTDPHGREYTTPTPKFAAKAFAVLVELFRYARSKSKTAEKQFLFPSGGYVKTGLPLRVHKKENIGSLAKYIADFCNAAGVEYQHAHKFRKTLATLLINHDVGSLRIIQFLLGHETHAMTMKYIMSLPGVNEEILNRMWEEQAELVEEWCNDVDTGHVGGKAGERAEEAHMETKKYFEGNRIPYSIAAMTQSLRNANYMILRTPAAWCMRLPSRVPHTAPCLEPDIQRAIKDGELEVGTDVQVNPEHCQPHLCGDAGHSRSDLKTARRARKWAEKKVANSRGTQAKLEAKEELEYWTRVEHRLTQGRCAVATANGGTS